MKFYAYDETEMKEKIANIIDGFLRRNSDYVIIVYLKDKYGHMIGNFNLPGGRIFDREIKDRYLLWKWNNGYGVNSLNIPYGEVITVNKETDEYGSQSVDVKMRNGIIFQFVCCGEKC